MTLIHDFLILSHIYVRCFYTQTVSQICMCSTYNAYIFLILSLSLSLSYNVLLVTDTWANLEFINLSRNKLTELPVSRPCVD